MSIDLHYECVGAGRAVVVLHGLFGSGRNWLTVARRMASDYAFYLVDLRNHGRSPHNATMTYLDMAGDVRALIEKLELNDVVLVGHSMGGKVAMSLALNDPRAISRLVNIDIAPVSYPDRFVEMIIAMRALDLSTIRRRGDADALLADAIPELSVRQFVLQNLMFDSGVARWRANLAALQDQMTYIYGPTPVCKTFDHRCERKSLLSYIRPFNESVFDFLAPMVICAHPPHHPSGFFIAHAGNRF